MNLKHNLICLTIFGFFILLSATQSAAQIGNGNFEFKIGRYEGDVLNTTLPNYPKRGKATFEMISIDKSSGKVRAHFLASDGLCGEANLEGYVDQYGRMQLTGTLVNCGPTMNVFVLAMMESQNTLVAVYQLTALNLGPQNGEFRVSLVEDRTPTSRSPSNSDDHTNSLFQQALALHQAGEYHKAIDSYKKVIQYNSKFYEAYFNLGLCHMALKQYTDAVSMFEQSIKLKPNAVEPYTSLSYAYLTLNKHQDAMAAAKQALLLDSKNINAMIPLGYSYIGLNSFKESKGTFEQAVQIKPDSPLAHLGLAVAFANLDQYQDALASCKQAIRLKPDYVDAYITLSYAYERLDQHEESIATTKQALRIDPNTIQAYLNMGYSQNQLGQYREALVSGEQFLRLNKEITESGPAYYLMGYANDKLGQRVKALELYKKAITYFKQSRDQSADMQFYLGNAYLQIGQYQEAITMFKQAVKTRPRFAQPHLSLGIAYLAVSNKQAALEQYAILKSIDPSRAERLHKAIKAGP